MLDDDDDDLPPLDATFLEVLHTTPAPEEVPKKKVQYLQTNASRAHMGVGTRPPPQATCSPRQCTLAATTRRRSVLPLRLAPTSAGLEAKLSMRAYVR